MAIRGANHDGRKYVPNLHVAAVIADAPVVAPPGVTTIYVHNARKALAQAAAAVADYPGKEMCMIGITGTNGKTTTAWMIEHIALQNHIPIGVIGTIGHRLNGQAVHHQDGRTTPEASHLQPLLRSWKEQGCQWVVMEVSSIGLALHRVDGIPFSIACFTNFSRDHLDFHDTMEDYLAAKSRLFTELLDDSSLSIINGMDEACRAQRISHGKCWYYGHQAEHQLQLTQIQQSLAGTQATIQTPVGTGQLQLPLIGQHNLENAVAAIGCCLGAGLALQDILQALTCLPPVPGRLERVPNPLDLAIFVDYAHTPDALRHVLQSLKPLCAGRLIGIFGCGGDRDPGKRSEMGEVALQYSDLPIVTSDNPRSEDPQEIINDIVRPLPTPLQSFVAREEAIEYAIQQATPQDIVLIAGKGHENYQLINGTKRHFDDRKQAYLAVQRKMA